jgi:uracil-DNA glycosylase family 4
MDDRRRRAWSALGLGPIWTLRGAAAPSVDAGVDAGVDARSAPAPGEPPRDPARALAPAAADPGARARAIEGLSWDALAEAVAGCTACGLCETRRRTVFGVGARPAAWMFVGEAPGEQEDARGEPFVGDAGALLDRMLASIDVSRERDAFIANVLKCRPPRNRDPLPEEVARCEPYLLRQIELVQPRVIVALGRFAAQSLLRSDAPIARLRGRVHAVRVAQREIPLVVTYHPAYLLRNLPDKSRSWADLLLARRALADGADADPAG